MHKHKLVLICIVVLGLLAIVLHRFKFAVVSDFREHEPRFSMGLCRVRWACAIHTGFRGMLPAGTQRRVCAVLVSACAPWIKKRPVGLFVSAARRARGAGPGAPPPGACRQTPQCQLVGRAAPCRFYILQSAL